MGNPLGLIFHPSLAENPKRILLVATVVAIVGLLVLVARLLGAGRRLRLWPCLAMAGLWALYALYEAALQGSGANIRIDLLLIHPGLTISSVVALIAIAFPRPRAAPPGVSPAGGAVPGGPHRPTT